MRKQMYRSWETIGSVLGKSIVKVDSDESQSLSWLDFQWKIIVGKDLALVSRVNKLSSKSLFVTVSDKAWFSSLESLREKTIHMINDRAGSVLVNRIVFQEGFILDVSIKNSYEKKKQYSLMGNKAEIPETVVKDESMQTILDRISFKLKIVLPVAILIFVSNCTTYSRDLVSQNIDLSNSYAVQAFEKISRGKDRENIRDPRVYYHYLMALQGVRGHQFEQASDNFSKVVQFAPGDYEFYLQSAINLIRAGKIENAYRTLEESLGHFPDNSELNMMIGDILSRRLEYEKALGHYQRVAQTKLSSARALLLSGAIYEIRQQYDLAEEMYKKLLQIEPNNPLGHFYLARIKIIAGKLEDAKGLLNQTLELRPNLLHAREFLAWVLEAQGKPDEAKKQYKKILKLDPFNEKIQKRMTAMKYTNLPMNVGSSIYLTTAKEVLGAPEVHMKIGAVYYEQGIYLKALDEFQLLKGRKQNNKISMVLGRIYEVLGRIDLAIQEINTLMQTEPRSTHLMIYLARLHSMNKQPKKTVQLIEEAIKLDENNDTLYHSLAIAFIEVDQLDKAIDSMQKAIEINKDKDSYYFELGALLQRTGEFERAIKNIKYSIELNPMHSNAHNFLGYIYAMEGKSLDKALSHLNKALSIQPKNGFFLDSLSWIYFKKGESGKALRELKKAMVYTAPDPVLYSHLGDIHFSLMNYIEASKAWETSLFLTLEEKDDVNNELPDPKELKEKIQKVKSFLNY
ncbi:MAG: DciA family protein [Nitrospinaceae bacterium]|nr:DciA family protein [Nitrospinaceae bacterium]